MISRTYIVVGVLLAGIGGVLLFFVAEPPVKESAEERAPAITLPAEEKISTDDPAAARSENQEHKTAEATLSYIIPIDSPGVFLDVMETYAKSREDFAFETKTFPGLGAFVESVNGVKNANGFYWTLFVNGALSDKGASSLFVEPGDILEWRYQKGI